MSLSDEIGVDTKFLLPHQLTNEEWDALIKIEKRLTEVSREAPHHQGRGRDCADSEAGDFAPPHLASVETRYQRVLLLDGGRGTGKTSLLLTFIKRWHGAVGALDEKPWLNPEQESIWAERKKSMFPRSLIDGPPKNIRVIRNLDFDPLPPGMPLVAGIVQAWRPLAEYYDRKTFPSDDLCDNLDQPRLMDLWHSLFRVAAGWSAVAGAKGLIEQVLDQEEQVRDWQDLRGKWLWFINEVIRVGLCLKSDRLERPPVFVIIIDDVDLQVERVRELLPALRLLTHENLFFLIAADSEHMVNMLEFDFLGQQRKLASEGNDSSLLRSTSERWARVLSDATFEKVFPTRNRCRLGKLSLSAFLNFPPDSNVISGSPDSGQGEDSPTFGLLLESIVAQPLETKSAETASKAISNLATAAESVSLDLPALSYRSAQQLWQEVVSANDSLEQATTVLARLLSGNVSTRAVIRGDRRKTIEVQAIGELTAFYRPGFIDAGEYDIVVSAQPDFWLISPNGEISSMRENPDGRFNFTAGLVAKTLQEGQFAVDATALKWETYLSLAWTAWRDISATFAWTWHKHPKPDELLAQTAKWGEYITKIYDRTNLRERLAYAWIYFERERSLNKSDAKAPGEIEEREELPWDDLLKFPKFSRGIDDLRKADARIWQTVTLPLLARPEIGLPPQVQEALLHHIGRDDGVKRTLQFQRRRLVTDAVFVAGLQRRTVKYDLPSDEVLRQKIQHIDRRYAELNGPSPWVKKVEQDSTRRATRKVN